MRETTICKLCLEPIQNYLCADCLHDDVKKWLSAKSHSFAVQIESFDTKLKQHFSTKQNTEYCMKCRNEIKSAFCMYCYVKEVFQWIFFKDPWLAQKFVKLFNFDFAGTGFLMVNEIRNLAPVVLSERKRKSDSGICENCGNTSEELIELNGEWNCESCRDEYIRPYGFLYSTRQQE